jgi:hypothetical protein
MTTPPRRRKWRVNAAVFWNKGDWSASAFYSRVNGFTNNSAGNTLTANSTAITYYPTPAVSKLDVRVGYEFRNGIWRDYGKGLRVNVGREQRLRPGAALLRHDLGLQRRPAQPVYHGPRRRTLVRPAALSPASLFRRRRATNRAAAGQSVSLSMKNIPLLLAACVALSARCHHSPGHRHGADFRARRRARARASRPATSRRTSPSSAPTARR